MHCLIVLLGLDTITVHVLSLTLAERNVWPIAIGIAIGIEM